MDEETTALLRLAAQLRQAAVHAQRADVVAKLDEVILLIAGEDQPAAGGRAASVMQFLDGLGF